LHLPQTPVTPGNCKGGGLGGQYPLYEDENKTTLAGLAESSIYGYIEMVGSLMNWIGKKESPPAATRAGQAGMKSVTLPYKSQGFFVINR